MAQSGTPISRLKHQKAGVLQVETWGGVFHLLPSRSRAFHMGEKVHSSSKGYRWHLLGENGFEKKQGVSPPAVPCQGLGQPGPFLTLS